MRVVYEENTRPFRPDVDLLASVMKDQEAQGKKGIQISGCMSRQSSDGRLRPSMQSRPLIMIDMNIALLSRSRQINRAQ